MTFEHSEFLVTKNLFEHNEFEHCECRTQRGIAVIEARFYHKSAFKTMKKEVLIYDTPTLIGTIGGFLGLFIGFSFFDFVSFIIDKLDSLSQSQSNS